MSDPILDAHEEAPGFYLLSGPSPISIRDQMLRGVLLVERLREARLIAEDRWLAVAGAGAGGASAAIYAAERSIPCVLFERHNEPFTAQYLSSTRFVDPTEYDWPVDHWNAGTLPWGAHVPLALGFDRGWANTVASEWRQKLATAEVDFSGILYIRYNDEPHHVWYNSGFPNSRVHVSSNSRTNERFGALIWAGGFLEENRRIFQSGTDPQYLVYEGQKFWSRDWFADLRTHVPDPMVLISGSGDGALQDYLRIMVGPKGLNSAKELYCACKLPKSILGFIQSEEDRAHRGRQGQPG